jgi:mRNA interferase RelE/StbE
VYRLLFHPGVEKQLARIPRIYSERLARAIRNLGTNPRPEQTKHLDKEMYRLREGEYRIVYAVFDEEQIIYVGKVERRSEKTYRDIARLLERAQRVVEEHK